MKKEKQQEEQTVRQGKWLNGIWYPTKVAKLKNPNSKGYNKYKKNPNPVIVSSPKDIYEAMNRTEREQRKMELYRASRRFYSLYQSALRRFNQYDKLDRPAEVEYTDEQLLEISKR